MSSERMKKEIQEAANAGERALTSLLYVRANLNAARSQKIYTMIRTNTGRAMVRRPRTIDSRMYMDTAVRELTIFRRKLRETHIPSELEQEIRSILVMTSSPFGEIPSGRMYQSDLENAETEVEQVITGISGLLTQMRKVGGC